MLGSFVGTKEASNLSDSALFSGQTVPFVGRFSIDGPDLGASDARKSPRSMALRFQLPNGELYQTAMLNTPVCISCNRLQLPTDVVFLECGVAFAHDTVWKWEALIAPSTRMTTWRMSARRTCPNYMAGTARASAMAVAIWASPSC